MKFHIGQRVRIRWSKNWPELSGETGVIVGKPSGEFETQSPDCIWYTAPDCWGSCRAPRRGDFDATILKASSDQLEPILPEGSAPSEFRTLADLLNSLGAEVKA